MMVPLRRTGAPRAGLRATLTRQGTRTTSWTSSGRDGRRTCRAQASSSMSSSRSLTSSRSRPRCSQGRDSSLASLCRRRTRTSLIRSVCFYRSSCLTDYADILTPSCSIRLSSTRSAPSPPDSSETSTTCRRPSSIRRRIQSGGTSSSRSSFQSGTGRGTSLGSPPPTLTKTL